MLTVSWPAVLADPHLRCAALVLSVLEGLHDVVEEGVCRVVKGLALPIAERVHKTVGLYISSKILHPKLARKSYRRLTPPVRRGFAVPSAYLFQLSAVPTFVLGNRAFTWLIRSKSCWPLRSPRYKASEPTVIP